ncbi:hypothetical protein [Paenibacillus brevis]|uniref:Uncharacterized protein n=1 Tax=Paenibacillus brevis TaxID=2841508 RepID=A0ABS6FLL2_9BACL|nr:hypothetical protein [Paenibacillus brevis]MBU5671046.1 hypothetical protein [Paenibacillus brevis]
MDYDESELTRRCLLNSHSRGSLEEVASEDDVLVMSYDMNESEINEADMTSHYLRQAYE